VTPPDKLWGSSHQCGGHCGVQRLVVVVVYVALW